MFWNRRRIILTHLVLAVGAVALLAAGADHLDEYAANDFSTVPTIGTLFLLNFIAATLVGVGLLLPLGRIGRTRGRSSASAACAERDWHRRLVADRAVD
jgi:hypothetical protein